MMQCEEYPPNFANLSMVLTSDNNGINHVTKDIVIPVIFTFGIFGNLVSLGVFCQRNQSTNSSDHVERSATVGLITLAVSDLLFCLIGFPAVFFGRHTGWVSLVSFYYEVYRLPLHNIFLFSSTWLIVLISAERFIGVCFPFPARSLIRVPRTLTAHAIVFISSVILNLPLFFKWKIITIEEEGCYPTCTCYGITPGWLLLNKTFEEVRVVLWFTVGTFIPLFVLIFCYVCILRAILSGKRAQSAANNPVEQAAHRRITWTLLAIVICYFLLVCPSTMLKFLAMKNLDLDMDPHHQASAVLVTNILQAIKFSCNFLLYCAVHRRFRETVALRLACLNRTTALSGMSTTRDPKRAFEMVQQANGKAELTEGTPAMQV